MSVPGDRAGPAQRDQLETTTTRIVRENQAMVIQDLTVRNLARAIWDVPWRDLRAGLDYKATGAGGDC